MSVAGAARRLQIDVAGTTESYEADASDDGEPGRGVDQFRLLLSKESPQQVASGYLAGGNIQLHKPDCQ